MATIKAITNWTRIGGCDLAQAIQTQFIEEEIVKPSTDELLQVENAVLLHRKMRVDNDPESGTCEMELSLCPRFKIAGLTVICTVPKMEIFLGSQNEYYETEHGTLADDCPNDELNDTGNLRSYRYDIEIEKSGVTEVKLRLLTTNDEICIFAMLLHIGPNPNGITTLLSNPINLENVKKMLESSNQKLTPNAEKCKQFLEMFGKAKSMQANLAATATTTSSVPVLSETETANEVVVKKLNTLIDDRLQKFEANILSRLDAFEARQNAKLDEIIKALQALK